MNAQPTPLLNRAATKKAKRLIAAVIGGAVLAVGLAMVVLPGPAIVVIPVGLAILATEFAWARHWLRKARERLSTKPTPPAASAPTTVSLQADQPRTRAAAACRNAIASLRTGTLHQPRSGS